MNETDWLMLGCLALGWAQGLWVGWFLWRKPAIDRIFKGEKK